MIMILLDIVIILLLIFDLIFYFAIREERRRHNYLINRIEGIEQDIFDLDDEIEELKEAKP